MDHNSQDYNHRKLILGLGNPGNTYAHTRHNIGFMVLDALAENWKFGYGPASRGFSYGSSVAARHLPFKMYSEVIFVKPFNYMNNSGIAARQAIEYLRLKPASLFVIYDDLDLPLGKIRVRKKGSAGGHKGMQSIIQHLDTEDFPRLRLGIGPQDEGVAAEDFVLATFRPEEEPAVREIIQLSIVVVQDFIRNGIEYTMAKYNPLQFSCAEKPGDSV